ncbi:MAG: OmpH family outer membrane protein [Bacteroidota bacterium]
MRTIFLLIFLGCVSIASYAQTQPQQPVVQKIGYADWDYIFTLLPEFKQIDSDLKTFASQLENQLKAKSQELETKYKAYQAMPATTPDAIKADKERELQGMQESIQKFQQDAQTSLQTKQNTLMAPVYEKVGKAIEEVAKENDYSFILSPQVPGGTDILLYSDEKYNISLLVLKKLGITPPAVPATKTN